MKIVFGNPLSEYFYQKVEELKRKYPSHKFVIKNKEEEDFINEIKDADCIVDGHLDEEIIKFAEELKVVFVPFAGIDKLSTKVLKEKGVIVSNSHGNARTVAERALALTLSLMGRVVEYNNDLKKGIWHGFSVREKADDTWESIQNKTCGIIGVGNIGLNIAKYLKIFDCKTIGFKRNINISCENIDELNDNLDYVLNKSDILFLSLPLTKNTKGIINNNYLSKMHNKFLINVGRGHLIEEKDLYKALKENTIKGFASDVWYIYPDKESKYKIPSKYPIHLFKNVVLSPHVAGYNDVATKGSIEGTIENIAEYIENGKPKNIFNLNEM